MPHWLQQARRGSLILFCLMLAVSFVISPLPKRTILAMLPLLLGLGLYIGLPRWLKSFSATLFVRDTLILISVGIGFLAPLGMLENSAPLQRWPLLHTLSSHLPDTFNANVVAGTLVVLYPFGLAALLAGTGTRGRWGWRWILAGLAEGAFLFVLYLSRSRGALLATFISLPFFLFLYRPKVVRWLLPLLVALALVGGTYIGWGRLLEALSTGGSISGLDQRLEIWSRALVLIQTFPFTGIGLGCFEPLLKVLFPLFLLPEGTVSHAHNLFLQVAVDLGLPGLVAYLVLLGSAFVQAIHAYRTAAQAETRLLTVACLASLIGMSLHGLLDTAVWGNKGAFLPWIVMGLAMALGQLAPQGDAKQLSERRMS